MDDDKQLLELTYTLTVPVFVNKTVKVEENGIVVERVVTETQFVVETRRSSNRFESIQVSDASGKKFASPEGFNRLKVGQVVVQTQNPAGLDPAYRALLARDTMILAPAAVAPK